MLDLGNAEGQTLPSGMMDFGIPAKMTVYILGLLLKMRVAAVIRPQRHPTKPENTKSLRSAGAMEQIVRHCGISHKSSIVLAIFRCKSS